MLLDVRGLRLYYRTSRGVVRAVDGVSFSIDRGEALAIVGESGSGKSSIAISILRVLPRNVHTYDGQIVFEGIDLMRLDEARFNREIRWKRISMVFQSSMSVLNPVLRVRDHVLEIFRLHTSVGEREAIKIACDVLERLGLPRDVLDRYPHELSGGMKQRVVIAMALLLSPDLVILDEPTSALDVITQANIMNLLKLLKMKDRRSMMFITHDIALASDIADRIAIMYGGKIVEIGQIDSVLLRPRHPYTRMLLASIPRLRSEVSKLEFIPGQPPDLISPPPGCRFHPRCPQATDRCVRDEPPEIEVERDHVVKCWLHA